MTEKSNSFPIDTFAKANKFGAALPADGAPVLYLLGGDGTLRWVSDSLLDFCGIDPMQLFGTEQLDFIAAMYGEMTVELKDRRIVSLIIKEPAHCPDGAAPWHAAAIAD